jgi:hypothetical protein
MKKTLSLVAATLLAGSAFAAVTFQVDANFHIDNAGFDPVNGTIHVRGDFNGWGGDNEQLFDPDLDGIFVGSYDMPAGPHEYKVIMDQNWEGTPNRAFTYDGVDLTLDPVCYNDQCAVAPTLNAEVLFQVDMGVKIAQGGFDPMTDLIVIRGSHANIGNWGGAVALDNGGMGTVYSLEVQFDGMDDGAYLDYKYVVLAGGDPLLADWENVPGGGNRYFQFDINWPDTEPDTYLEHVTPLVFFSGVSWDDVLATDVMVTFNVDLAPVMCYFAQGGAPQFGLNNYGEITYVGVLGGFNGWPWGAVPLEWQAVNTTGTIWSLTTMFTAGSPNTLLYKYGANGDDNESGFQEDHITPLDDTLTPGFVVINDVFGSLGDLWPCTPPAEAEETPSSFALKGNYPNPFNPVTTIDFSLEETAVTSLTVYDMSGAEVTTLFNGMAASGDHSVSFDASSLASGVYFYTLRSNGIAATEKMLLVK